ncbi:MAG: hypothetical protein JWL88_162 [Parcubacteria group bacterium]|nr:hypothetical protein [Parcubacteria group bacterium]
MKAGFGWIIGFLLLAGALPAFAQVGTDPITISIDSQYPRPYSAVTVTPQSTLIDLNSSQVTVSVNGVVVQKGSGSAPVQIQAGAAGVRSTISVTAVTSDGQTYKKTLTFSPADVALIEEPVSTTHPFYRGAPLVASEGLVRLVALPDLRTASGAPIPASSLVYTWKNGNQVLESDSGIGKSVLTATAPVQFRDTTVTVTVTTKDDSVVAQASALISPVNPIARIYQNDPLLGPLFNTALPATIAMSDPEDTFRGVPYYFTGTPSLSWTVNGTESQAGQDITVRSNGSGQGTAVVGFQAKQADTNQLANILMTIQFGAKKSLGIFGL